MSLSSLAVRRPIGTAMFFVGLTALGIVGLSRLPIDLMPSADFPRISVTTLYEGVAPEEMETLITRPIEQALSTIQGVTKLESSSSEGLSRVQLEFNWGADLDVAANDVRAQLDRLRNSLPEGAETPVTYKFDISSFPIARLGLSGAGDPGKLRYVAEETLSRRLERVPGVASVQVRGGRIREVHVLLDPSRLVALGVSAQEVSAALARINRNVSAGSMIDVGREVVVRTVGEFDSLEAIERSVVAVRQGRAIRVRDLGRVIDTYRDLTNELWIEGHPGIQLRVSKQDGANTLEVIREVKAELERINRDHEGQYRLSMLWNAGDFIRSAIGNVQNAGLIGAMLAIGILLLFLRSLRGTLVIGLAIPISVLPAFALMEISGRSLNVISFGGLALGVGMLVDNAIVILENIHRKREGGAAGERAAVEGSREVSSAITASTLTTLVVFVPVLFLGGFAGVFFREMAVVVCFALGCSLFVALTLVPSLSARLFRESETGSSKGFLAALEAGYERLVRGVLRRPGAFLLGFSGVLAISLTISSAVNSELMPETDEGLIDVRVDLAVGTAIRTTMDTMQEVETRVRSVVRPEELTSMTTVAGPENWWRPAGSHQGSMEIQLVPVSERSRSVSELAAAIGRALADVPGVRAQVREGSSNLLLRFARGGGDRLSVHIRGHDLATANRLTEEVERTMRAVPGITFVRAEQEAGALERTVVADPTRLAELGLSTADVADAVEHYVLGKVTTRYREVGNEFDLRVRLEEKDRTELDRLPGLPILTPSGDVVPLGSVARIEKREGPSSIARVGQERVIKVNAGFAGRPLEAIARDLEAALQEVPRPDGFSLAIAGEVVEQEKAFGGLTVGILLAIFLVYAVMVIQFESLLHPLIVMTSIPFASIGVVLALVLTGTTFNMNSFLGAIVLVGIVVNNAIVLIDYANLLRREQGMELFEAIALTARRRLRPILMTTATTMLGMLPLALGIGEAGELQRPLAIVVIGGLLLSTVVTLGFVPAAYLLLERTKVRALSPRLAEAAK